ncbi:MAG TPA: RES family NAD+ phosphorylase [Actinomycetota bacterium]|nr:RES family NAD+ phosphorylase [Actinomycetota bacterium]
MTRFRHVTRGGRYSRVVDPDWKRPLDPSFAAERGGRWNPPGSFPVVYLCATREVARANVLRRFDGLPYGVLDLLPERRPALVETDVEPHRAVDVVTDAGCRAAGLPASYPRDGRGRRIAWTRTQPIGEAAWSQGERSVACRSAALAKDERGEELAWFPRETRDRLKVARRRSFDEWF